MKIANKHNSVVWTSSSDYLIITVSLSGKVPATERFVLQYYQVLRPSWFSTAHANKTQAFYPTSLQIVVGLGSKFDPIVSLENFLL